MDLQQMLARSHECGASPGAALISAYEAEQLISQLQATTIEEVGSARFLAQHDAIQKLNLQAHANVSSHSDEFVVELLVSHDKLGVLVGELLAIEAWRSHVYPRLAAHLAGAVDSATSYLLLFHEAAVANLLEVVLYHRHALAALPDDALLELGDWTLRKLGHLNSGAAHAHANAPERSLQEQLAASPLQDLEDKAAETAFSAALCGVTILRFLADGLPELPLGLMSRLLASHDAVMALLPLVENPPWARQRGGKLEKFVGGRWSLVPLADRFKLTQLDGQVWLALVALLVEPACRAKYDPDEYRRGCLLKLQRHLASELLLDQLPVLRQLGRVLDEMALGVDAAAAAAAAAAGGGGAAAAAAGRRLILEQVPVLRQALLRGKDWAAIADAQQRGQFGASAKQLAAGRLESLLASFELMAQMEEQQQQGAGGGGGGGDAAAAGSLLEGAGADEDAVLAAPVRVVVSRQVHSGGMWEHWCEFSAALDASKPGQHVSVSSEAQCGAAAAAAAAGSAPPGGSTAAKAQQPGSSSSSAAAAAAAVSGMRYRLAPLEAGTTRALPVKGKLAVHFMGAVAEALLQLPEVPLRSAAAAAASDAGPGSSSSNSSAPAAPAALWLTVGLLAADGFALQLRLRLADKPRERDRTEGSWCAYHPVCGAITVLLPQQQLARAAGAGSKVTLVAPKQDVACVKP